MEDSSFSHLIRPDGRINRTSFLASVSSTLGAQWTLAYLIDAIQRVERVSYDSIFLLKCLTVLPFAWILVCCTVQRMRDIGWNWIVAVPGPAILFFAVCQLCRALQRRRISFGARISDLRSANCPNSYCP